MLGADLPMPLSYKSCCAIYTPKSAFQIQMTVLFEKRSYSKCPNLLKEQSVISPQTAQYCPQFGDR